MRVFINSLLSDMLTLPFLLFFCPFSPYALADVQISVEVKVSEAVASALCERLVKDVPPCLSRYEVRRGLTALVTERKHRQSCEELEDSRDEKKSRRGRRKGKVVCSGWKCTSKKSTLNRLLIPDIFFAEKEFIHFVCRRKEQQGLLIEKLKRKFNDYYGFK